MHLENHRPSLLPSLENHRHISGAGMFSAYLCIVNQPIFLIKCSPLYYHGTQENKKVTSLSYNEFLCKQEERFDRVA